MATTHLSEPDFQGLHGNFAWSCAAEGCALDLKSSCDGFPFIAGISDDGAHIYAGCVEDVLHNPQMYEDENLIIHGTHQLSDELLEEAYGPDRGMPPADSTYQDRIYALTVDGLDDDGDIVAVAIDNSDSAILLTAAALLNVLDHPDKYDGYVLYGTHILPEHVLTELFGPAGDES